jgi:AcrR family transcriptional regulator
MPPVQAGDGAQPKRLPRGTLTEEMILEATLRLLDTEGIEAFSMPRLGRELGASSTAVYRHFPSRDHIVLGVADLLIGEALDGFEPAGDWVATLRDLALRLWDAYVRHPAAGALTHMRTTRRPHEMRAVDAIVRAVRQAGWEGVDAMVQYRGFSAFVLSTAGTGATFSALPDEERAGDESAWRHDYRVVDPDRYPDIAAIAPYFGAAVTERDVYELQVDLYLEAMRARAPRKRS